MNDVGTLFGRLGDLIQYAKPITFDAAFNGKLASGDAERFNLQSPLLNESCGRWSLGSRLPNISTSQWLYRPNAVSRNPMAVLFFFVVRHSAHGVRPDYGIIYAH